MGVRRDCALFGVVLGTLDKHVTFSALRLGRSTPALRILNCCPAQPYTTEVSEHARTALAGGEATGGMQECLLSGGGSGERPEEPVKLESGSRRRLGRMDDRRRPKASRQGLRTFLWRHLLADASFTPTH